MSVTRRLHGESSTARYVAEKMSEHSLSLQMSNSVGIGSVFDELAEVWEECREPNWDGHNAVPISRDALRNAYMFLEALPLGFPRPSLGADPHGQVSVEWYLSSRRVLSVGISEDGQLHYAALIGPNKTCGTEVFFGDVPEEIINLVRRVYS